MSVFQSEESEGMERAAGEGYGIPEAEYRRPLS
jgi:hypothetical protein